MADIFLSYSSRDQEKVRPLVHSLEQQGWSVWWDRKIPPGKTWHQVIEEALDAAKCVIVVWSQCSIVSDWVITEAEEGKERKILIPVLFEEVKAPLAFRRIQAVRLVGWQGDESHPELKFMFETIRALTGEAPLEQEPLQPITKQEPRNEEYTTNIPYRFERRNEAYEIPKRDLIRSIHKFLGWSSDQEESPKEELPKRHSERVLSRIVAQVFGALVSLVGTILIVKYGLQPSKSTNPTNPAPTIGSPTVTARLVPLISWTQFSTGILGFGSHLEASGVQAVAGSNGVLIVSDDRQSEVLWMQLDENGQQFGSIKDVSLGVKFKDLEAITYGNGYYYLVTSQSDPQNGAGNAIVRFGFDPVTQVLRGQAEIINDLRSFLLQNVIEISALGAPSGMQGGLNIEGIAWDPSNERLLLGLRSPQMGNQAMMVPMKLRDPRGAFTVENLKVDEPRVIVLSLDGHGIRDITYDPQLKDFLIISGAPETSPKTDFILWEWNGQPNSKPTRLWPLDDKMKPEGVTSVSIGGRSFVFIVGDAGSYLKLDYLRQGN